MTIPAYDSTDVEVSFSTGAAGPASLGITATKTGESRDYSVHFTTGTAAVSVLPKNAVFNGLPVPFVIQNTGTTRETYTISCSRTWGTASACTPDLTSVTLAPGFSANVSVTADPTNLTSVGLEATAQGSVADSARQTAYQPWPYNYWTTLSPSNSHIVAAGNDSITATYVYRNSGSATVTPFTCSYTGDLQWCRVVHYCINMSTGVTLCDVAGQSVPNSWSTTIEVKYGTASEGTATTTLKPLSGGAATASTILIQPPGGDISLRSFSPSAYQAYGKNQTATYVVRNLGVAADEFAISCEVTNLSSCRTNKPLVVVAPQDSEFVEMTFDTGNLGFASLTVSATGSGYSDSDQYSFTLSGPVLDIQPEQGTAYVPPGTDSAAVSFTVGNVGDEGEHFDFECHTDGGISWCGMQPHDRLMSVGDTIPVVVHFGATGDGTIELRAVGRVTGYTVSGFYDIVARGPMISLEPDSGIVVAPTFTNAFRVPFTVKNTGDVADVVAFPACTAIGLIASCTAPPNIYIAAHSTIMVYATVNTGAVGVTQITLTAKGAYQTDHGSITLQVADVSKGKPLISIETARVDNRIDRAECITAGAGQQAAVQCGDLIVAHSMPAFRSLDRDRQLTLLYNSGTVKPYPIIMADVRLPLSVERPTYVTIELQVGGTTYTHLYSGSEFTDTTWQRIAVGFPDATDSTGVYDYRLVAKNVYAGTPEDSNFIARVDTGRVIVVNRTESPYGRGWWVAGIDQLKVQSADTSVLLVGADASAALYEKIAPNRWLAPLGAYRDTIDYGVWTVGGSTESFYRRTLKNGVKVFFDGAGRQRFVMDRDSQVVEYNYRNAAAAAPVSTIRITPRAANMVYTFNYLGQADCVTTLCTFDRITDPAGRILDVNIASGQLIYIYPPGFSTTSGKRYQFTYSTSHLRMTQANTIRGQTDVTFGYDSIGSRKITQVLIPRAVSGPKDTIRYKPIHQDGLGRTAYGNVTLPSVDAHYEIDGPRHTNDVTRFWVNARGLPTRIENAEGGMTTLYYTNAVVPLLPTRVVDPVGRDLTFSYDSSARLITETDETNAFGPVTVTFEYNDANAPDKPSRITIPRDSTSFDSSFFYYNSFGRPDSIIVSHRSHKTVFHYLPKTSPGSGRLYQIDEVGVSSWDGSTAPISLGPLSRVTKTLSTRFHFDDLLFNVDTTYTPSGHWTAFDMDAMGRVTAVTHEDGETTTYDYTPRNQVATTTVMDGVPYATHFTYDDDGNLTMRTDPRSVSRSWGYDPLGRQISMTDEFGRTESRLYDGAGNLTRLINRSGDTTTYVYDRLNRDRLRIVGAAWVGPPETGLYNRPLGSMLVPPDTIRTTWDAAGRPTSIGNRSALITRQYNREGTLAWENEYHRTTGKQLVQQFRYLPGGERREHTFERFGSPLGSRTHIYSYGPGGVLESIDTGPTGVVEFGIDELGRRESLHFRNGTDIEFAYDDDSRLRRYFALRTDPVMPDSKAIADAVYTDYDAAGRVKQQIDYDVAQVLGFGGATYTYNERGYLVQSQAGGRETTNWYDASGNLTAARTRLAGTLLDSVTYSIASGTNRVMNRVQYGPTGQFTLQDTYRYDLGGNRNFIFSSDSIGWVLPNDSLTYLYRGDGLSSGYHATRLTPGALAPVADSLLYQYDGLGRLIGQHYRFELFHDGPNVLAAIAGGGQPYFLNGPGVDDALLLLTDAPDVCAGGHSQEDRYYLTIGGRFLDLQNYSAESCGPGSASIVWEGAGKYAGPAISSFGFGVERTKDDATGLSYFRNRWYDSRTGRFTQEDPIGYAGGENLYAYAGNNPASYTDPFGLCEPLCSAVDAALLAADINDIRANGANVGNVAGVLLGSISTALPVVTGGGAVDDAVRGLAKSFQAAMNGMKVHREFAASMRAAGHLAEYGVKGGRIDGMIVDAATKTLHVIELKPNNARAIARGQEQLQRYVKALQNMEQWQGFRITTEIRTY